MNFEELKSYCDERIKSFPELNKRYEKELEKAKIAYDNNINLFNELNEKKDKINKRYVIPFLIGLTDSVDLSKPIEIKQAKPGDGGK